METNQEKPSPNQANNEPYGLAENQETHTSFVSDKPDEGYQDPASLETAQKRPGKIDNNPAGIASGTSDRDDD